MKFKFRHFYLLLMVIASLLPAGCLLKPANVTPRHFILTSTITNDVTSLTTNRLAVGIGRVTMPAYLLRDSLAVRSDTSEIEYFESASWADRLDHCFQHTLAANLSKLLASDRIYVSDWARDQATVCVFVNLEQFDVDSAGHGILVAQWRISAPDNDHPLRSGQIRLTQDGSSPRGHPEAVASTLSALTGEFSRKLAQDIVDCTKSNP